MADGWRIVPPCSDPAFTHEVLEYCTNLDISLVIPTIDTELAVYAHQRRRFAEHGVQIAISGPRTVEIAMSKDVTSRFLESAGVPTVKNYSAYVEGADPPPFPVIIKPRQGSGSKGIHRADDLESFRFYLRKTADPVVQEFVDGVEYTVNFFVDRSGRCLSAVPHVRVETRSGEVSKCVTVREPTLMAYADRLAASLPDAWGPLCFQAVVDSESRAKVIELNARLGGGYPVAHAAGVNYVRWLVDDARGLPLPEPSNVWRDGLAMIRWEDAVFTTAADVGM